LDTDTEVERTHTRQPEEPQTIDCVGSFLNYFGAGIRNDFYDSSDYPEAPKLDNKERKNELADEATEKDPFATCADGFTSDDDPLWRY